MGPLVKTLKSSEGIALYVAILVMTIVMLFLGASLFLSRVDTKISDNFKLGTQVLEVADAGLQHAMTLIQNGYDFDNTLNCGTPPCTILSSTTFPSGSNFTYTVTVENNSADINNGGSATDDTDNIVVLLSTANGPNDSRSQIQAFVNRSTLNFTPPSALYMPANSMDADFSNANGPVMLITGDDTEYNGVTSGTQPSITGVTTTDPSITTDFLLDLGASLYNNVRGSGYSTSPIVIPSVSTTTNVFDVNQIATSFFNHGSAVKFLDGYKLNCSSPCTLGTDASPQITYVREGGSDHIHFDGNVTGSGVLVTEGRTHLYGNFEFHGLVINVNIGTTGGETNPEGEDSDPLVFKENAKVFGAVLIGPTNGAQSITIKDNAKIFYNSSAIDMANSLCGSCLPKPPKVFAWFDE